MAPLSTSPLLAIYHPLLLSRRLKKAIVEIRNPCSSLAYPSRPSLAAIGTANPDVS
jgi:hypothetical protein